MIGELSLFAKISAGVVCAMAGGLLLAFLLSELAHVRRPK